MRGRSIPDSQFSQTAAWQAQGEGRLKSGTPQPGKSSSSRMTAALSAWASASSGLLRRVNGKGPR